jgi:hypothetical protein
MLCAVVCCAVLLLCCAVVLGGVVWCAVLACAVLWLCRVCGVGMRVCARTGELMLRKLILETRNNKNMMI